MRVYADTSVFVSLYLADRHFEQALQFVKGDFRIWLTPFHRAEWAHALSQHVFRGLVTEQEAERIRENFETDRGGGLWLVGDVAPVVFEICVDLARHLIPIVGGRTLDSIHIACAIELGAEAFRTFDERQAKLARAAGLKVI